MPGRSSYLPGAPPANRGALPTIEDKRGPFRVESREVAENIVIYDWLSFTSKIHTPQELIDVLGLSHVCWTQTKGARGYRDRLYYSAISIHYNGRDDMGVWVEMSGQGCRTFESLSAVGWDRLFFFIRENGLKITRLDVAYDDHTGILPMTQIVHDTQSGMFISRSEYWETVLSSKGSTVQIGSPQSKVLIRIYDKAAERHCEPGTHWIRCEIQLRDDRAAQFTKIPLPIGEAFAGVLLNYLRFVEPADDANIWRWPMTDYWRELVEDAQRISIYRTPGLEYNEDRLKNYVINQAGNAIDCLIKLYGIDELERMIDERPCKPNPKYDLLIRDHKLNQLTEKIRFFFGDDSVK